MLHICLEISDYFEIYTRLGRTACRVIERSFLQRRNSMKSYDKPPS